MAVISSSVVPTEYDIEQEGDAFTLVDDRGRRFTGKSVIAAFTAAEAAQDPNDPIHHPPYPSRADAPLPVNDAIRS